MRAEVYTDNTLRNTKFIENLTSLEKFPEDFKDKDDLYYKRIEAIINNLIDKFINVKERIPLFLKQLNFLENIFVDENNNVYIGKYIYVEMNFSGTIVYMDPIKGLINSDNCQKIYSQEFAFNLGKIVYYLLNHDIYRIHNQLFKKNDSNVFQKFLKKTLLDYKYIQNRDEISDLKRLYKVENNIKESRDNNNTSSYTSIMENKGNSEKGIEYNKLRDLNYVNYFGFGFIISCFCITPKKQKKDSYENFDISDKINNEIEEIFEKYKGVV
jgi:hypothetical protein